MRHVSQSFADDEAVGDGAAERAGGGGVGGSVSSASVDMVRERAIDSLVALALRPTGVRIRFLGKFTGLWGGTLVVLSIVGYRGGCVG